jgi:hypothetical protein
VPTIISCNHISFKINMSLKQLAPLTEDQQRPLPGARPTVWEPLHYSVGFRVAAISVGLTSCLGIYMLHTHLVAPCASLETHVVDVENAREETTRKT